MDLRRYHVEIDSLRYPRDIVLIIFEGNDYIKQYKDIKLYFEEQIGEPIINPPVSYPDIKTNHSIGIIDLRHQLDHIPPKSSIIL